MIAAHPVPPKAQLSKAYILDLIARQLGVHWHAPVHNGKEKYMSQEHTEFSELG